MAGKERLFNKGPKRKKDNQIASKRQTGFSRPSASPISHVLFLQSTIGNKAVQRLIKAGTIQPKLRIGRPNDIYEQEADDAANMVTNMSEPCVQRREEPSEKEEKSLQPKPMTVQQYTSFNIQPLSLGNTTS